jgi:hypothetical protein
VPKDGSCKPGDTYENVNRLTNAQARGGVNYNLPFSYTQDGSNGQYGNMTCVMNQRVAAVSGFLTVGSFQPARPTVGKAPTVATSFSTANNHITTAGYVYDAAGT